MSVRGPSLAALLPFALLLLAIPVSAIQVAVDNPTVAAPVTLYLHVGDPGSDFPITTEMPAPDAGLSPGGLSTRHSLCVGAADPATTLASKQYHTYYGFSTPDSAAGAAGMDGSDAPLRRGMAGDLELAYGAATLRFFLASQGGDPQAPTVLPSVVVRATLREGSQISVDDSAYNSGAVLLQGESAPALLAQGQTSGATYESVGDRDVYGFEVPLEVVSTRVNGTLGYNLRVDVLVENPYCSEPGASVMPDAVAPYLDAAHLPRLEISALGPVWIVSVVPSFLQHGVAVTVVAQAPWGPYDVDGSGANATIVGPSGAPGVYLADESVDAGDGRRLLTFFWPNEQDGAKGGLYSVTVQVPNLQRTAWANATAAFDLTDGSTYPAFAGQPPIEVEGARGQAMPGPGLLAVLAALGVAAFARAARR